MTSTLSFRCQCELCNDENLVGAREFRCCKEVANASAKMAFDGSTERITCITQHDDYVALTNRTVLLQVAPLLRDKNGRTYRRRTGVPENEWVQFCHDIFWLKKSHAKLLTLEFSKYYKEKQETENFFIPQTICKAHLLELKLFAGEAPHKVTWQFFLPETLKMFHSSPTPPLGVQINDKSNVSIYNNI